MFFLAGCTDPKAQSQADPFLEDLPQLAQKLEMPGGFIDEFTEKYYSEIEPEITRIRREVALIDQEPEIWNYRKMVYMNLWGDEGVEMRFIPRMTLKDYEALRSQISNLRDSVEEKEIEIAKLEAQVNKLKGEQGGAR